MTTYLVTLRSGATFTVLAPNSEQAAWTALELSHERNDSLTNVSRAYEW